MAFALDVFARRSAPRLTLNEKFAVGGPARPWFILGAAALLIIHLGFLGCGGSRAIAQAHMLATYVPVPATVTVSALRAWTTQGRHGTNHHYQPSLQYTYEVDGHWYSCDAVDAAAHHYSAFEAQAAVMRYHVGAHITAYRDPGVPRHAFLIRVCRSDPYMLIDFSILFCVLGLHMLIQGMPPSDVFARSRRLGRIAAYAMAIPALAALHFRMAGGRTHAGMLFLDISSGLFCIYPLVVWLRLRPRGQSPAVDAQSLAARAGMDQSPPR